METIRRVVEYRIHYGENGDSENVLIYEGKDYRKWEQHIGEDQVQWIERVEETVCESMGVLDAESHILWESDECKGASQ